MELWLTTDNIYNNLTSLLSAIQIWATFLYTMKFQLKFQKVQAITTATVTNVNSYIIQEA